MFGHPRLLALAQSAKPSQEETMLGKGKCTVTLKMQEVCTMHYNKPPEKKHIPLIHPLLSETEVRSKTMLYIPT